MNTLAKLGAAGALSLAYVSAHAALVSPTSTSPGDVLLFAEVLNSSGNVIGSYAGDTGVAVSHSLAAGTLISSSSDANLQSLLSLGAGAGNTIEWSVQGGGGTDPNGSAGQYGGANKAAFLTTMTNPLQFAGITGVNLNNWASLGGEAISTTGTVPLINLNLAKQQGLDPNHPELAIGPSIFTTATGTGGLWDTTNLNSNVQNWFQNGGNTAQTGLATSTLYYITGGGSNGAQAVISEYGTVTLTSAGLSFSTSGTAPVPLPAAIWLLGGGLLGLVGVGRRKAIAA